MMVKSRLYIKAINEREKALETTTPNKLKLHGLPPSMSLRTPTKS
jgi:hypothetical protein